jgi:gluconokinase
MRISGLRSSHHLVGGIIFFGRTLDKIRLHAAGRLPADYNRGHGLDGRVCRFLQVDYDRLVARTLKEPEDLKVLEWCFANGRRPSEEDIFIFNAFMTKRGWRDDVSDWVREQKEKMNLSHRDDLQTCFDIHDADEGRK